ncbi:hypothetical protein PTTG_06958 [Puccinia triticina 1-1 BBBD Race 1]|uniref:Uncharacterized protein n=1 Tax=Puccinia triticina (isolate 1-1 / race 1 (BBBD)) TaxID=630390 RepID=A0A0C4F1I7_PUCT1|nr:hypothetical protein PTTG_06958 [Puccinia triticina 1-1 BBBD Race 1]
MAPNGPFHTPDRSPQTMPNAKIPQARAACASSIHTVESTNPPSLLADTCQEAPRILAPPQTTTPASVPIHVPPPHRPINHGAVLDRRVKEISRNLHDTFPNNPIWEDVVFPATAVLEYLGAFCGMYHDLLYIAAVSPTQHCCRIHQLAERLELAIIFPTNKHILQAWRDLDGELQNKPHPVQVSTPQLCTIPPVERTRRASHSALP